MNVFIQFFCHKQNVTQGQFFKQSTGGLNSEFSFFKTDCLNKAKEPNLPNDLPIARERTDGFMPFPRVLAQSETQTL